jgi:hypothetical protein
MKHSGPTFTVFNRIAVFVLTSGTLIGMVVTLATPKFRNDLDIVTGFLFVTFAAMFSFGVWISLNWRSNAPEKVADFHAVDRPTISDDAIVCPFSTGIKSASIAVDPGAAVIHFENCHVPRRFLATAQTWFSCPISDVRAVHRFIYDGESLTIVTATGKALIPATATNYLELREFITDAVPENQRGFATDHPMMGMVYVAGSLVGLFGGVFLTPRNSSDSTLAVFVLSGTVLGVACSHLLIRLGDRWLKTGLAEPIGYGMIGVNFGLTVSTAVAPFIDWNMAPMIALALAGGIIGVIIGMKKQS